MNIFIKIEVTFFYSLAPYKVDLISQITPIIKAMNINESLTTFILNSGHLEHLKLVVSEYPTSHSAQRMPS